MTLLDIFIKNREKAIIIIKQFGELSENFGDLAHRSLDSLDDFSRNLLINTTFEVIEKETIKLESIKDYLLNVDREKIDYRKVALLKLGYNNKSNNHEFVIQFLDNKNKPKQNTQLVLIEGKSVDDNLHKAFANKELLILN